MTHPNAAFGNKAQSSREFPLDEKWLLRQAFRAIGPAPIQLRMQGGEGLAPPGVTPLATIVIRDLGTLARMIFDPEIAMGEAYAEGRIDVEGDLVGAMTAVYETWPAGRADSSLYARLTSQWTKWRQANTWRGSRNNIHSHYDLGNDFYKLWLDSQMVYTCAYFPSPAMTLEEAQQAKLDYICRKLRLQPGERVVEAGCGWGALALHMARNYGVSVKAFNISHEQIAYARQRAAALGLTDKVEFIEDDVRSISGQFDAFVSVGMLEHIGLNDYARLGEVIHRSIGDTGRGLLHFIGRSYKGDFSRWIRKRIFPGAYAPTLAEAMSVLQPHHYAVLDVENLRLHYAKTIEHWLHRFEDSQARISEMYDTWFYRAWRLYLAGSIAAFRVGTLQLFQVSFSGAKNATIPWTRAPLYAPNTSPKERTEDGTWKHAMS